MSDIFGGNSLSSEEVSYHTITCDNSYMHQLGLGVFTTGTLYEWFSAKDQAGNFINMKLISGLESSPIDPDKEDEQTRIYTAMRRLLVGGLIDVNFSYFKKINNGGEYINTTGDITDDFFKQWDFQENNIEYKASKLIFSDFDDKNITSADTNGNAQFFTHTNYDSPLTFISNIIEMNNYLRVTTNEDTRKSEKFIIRNRFISDIKCSKEKCAKWTSNVTFTLNILPAPCDKTVNLTFKLFLYDGNIPKKNARKLAINNPIIVAPPINATGRTGVFVDGKYIAPSINTKPSDSVAAPMDMSYDHFDGKWRSGTPQIIAQLTTNIDAATPVDLSKNLANAIDDLLNSVNQHRVTFGSGMPISMQNGNPYQWSPDYNKEESCRKDSTDKHMVRIVNPFPKAWASGEMVILNKIHGVWMPSAYGTPTETQGSIAFNEYKWQFTYLMTNSDFYFRTPDKSKVISPEEYEQAIYNLFYNGTNSLSGLQDGYFQVTSFDFMGAKIGGLRGKNALACTQFAFNPNGDALENNGEFLEGTQSAPFFGCVFPDGYNPGDKFNSYKGAFHPILTPVGDETYNIKPSNFMKLIPTGVNIFENANANIGSAAAGGMFVKQDDPTLKHLPADIALNASPSGYYGAPIRDIHYLHNQLNVSNNKDLFAINASNILRGSGCHWLSEKDKKFTSAFDFAPVNPLKIQFRPLKMEVYATFEHESINTVNSQVPGQRGEYGAYCWKLVDDKDCPIQISALNRNRTINPNNPLLGIKGLNYHTYIRGGYSNNFVSDTLPTSQYRFPQTWWNNRPWQTDLNQHPSNYDKPRPAGAIGVITAQCTVKALSKITFDTTNYLGITSWFGPNNIIISRPWYASWGASGSDSVSSLQTTSLWVKIYQAWPREQTIFDPRFFAVFHFNSNNDSLNLYWPTITVNNINQKITPNRYVWNEHTYDGSYFKLNDKSSWYISNERKGKLLPFNYQSPTIGFDIANIYIKEEASPSISKQAASYDIYIESKGKKYSVGELFKVVGGTGVSTILQCSEIDSEGGVKKFTFKDNEYPYGYSPTDFPNYFDDITVINKKLQIALVSGAGEGFKGYIVRGSFYLKNTSDDAPKKLNTFKLTPNPKSSASPSEAVIDPASDSINKVQVIDNSNKSSNDKYDIFLHFHNDTSHTMCHDHVGVGPVAVENHCTLEILPA